MTKKPETVNEVDLIKRKDGLYYKKYAKVPFTGKREYFHGNVYLFTQNFKNGRREITSEGFPETIKEEHLIRREDGLLYKKYARAPFTGKREYFQGHYLVIQNIKNGKEEGPYETFHENGQLSSKGNYKKGEKEGLWEGFNKNGTLSYRCYYKNGKLEGLTESFNEDGLCTSKVRYKNGKVEGLYESFHRNGQLEYRKSYKNGKTEGLWESFYESGQLRYFYSHKNGKLNGPSRSFNEDGLCKAKARYKNGFLKELWVRGRGKIKPGTKDFIEQGGFSVHLKKRTKD